MIRTLIFSFVVAIGATGASAATLNVNGSGQLLGAFGVDVGGQLYDVEFVDGTCIALFSGCDEVSDFTFQTQVDATTASQALLDQVFLNGVMGAFDTSPQLTNGITATFAGYIMTPYLLDSFTFPPTVLTMAAFNRNLVGGDFPETAGLYDTDDTAHFGALAYARWTPVPEPGTGLLVAGGLVLLSARRRSAVGR